MFSTYKWSKDDIQNRYSTGTNIYIYKPNWKKAKTWIDPSQMRNSKLLIHMWKSDQFHQYSVKW